MDTSRDRGAAEGVSIRLRYSRQFQSGGHAHNIDAEATLPVGANLEKREQVIRELESNVERLARQIVSRASRSSEETRPATPARPSDTSGAPMTPAPGQKAEEATLPMQKPAPSQPAATTTPVSESMPATPARSSEGTTVRLPQFINAIKKRWNMSLNEAMDLLHVTSLEGVNLREAYTQLQGIVEAKNAPQPRANPQPRITQSSPTVEAPRQDTRNAPQQSPSRLPPNQNPPASPGPRAQGPAPIALKEVPRPAPITAPVNTPRPEPSSVLSELPPGVELGANFAGSPKAPLPIHLATVRDMSARNTYRFNEEEDDEPEIELPDDEDDVMVRAQEKLDELKAARGTNAASAERLTVLMNVTDGLVSETELAKLIKGTWGHATPKKLKATQAEKLISWAKVDDFAAEVEAVLKLLNPEDGV